MTRYSQAALPRSTSDCADARYGRLVEEALALPAVLEQRLDLLVRVALGVGRHHDERLPVVVAALVRQQVLEAPPCAHMTKPLLLSCSSMPNAPLSSALSRASSGSSAVRARGRPRCASPGRCRRCASSSSRRSRSRSSGWYCRSASMMATMRRARGAGARLPERGRYPGWNVDSCRRRDRGTPFEFLDDGARASRLPSSTRTSSPSSLPCSKVSRTRRASSRTFSSS